MKDRTAPLLRDPSDRFQQEAKRTIQRIADKAIVDGVLLEDVDLSTATSRVYHRLGRPSRGVIVVDATDDTRVWRDGDSTGDFVNLKANATRTVSLWIF